MALYTIRNAASVLGIKEQRVRQLVKDKELGMKVGNMFMLTEADMDVLKARNTQRGQRMRVYRYRPVGEEAENDSE